MSDKGSAVAIEQTDVIDDIGGDVQSALNELRGGEGQPETPITLDKSERPRDEAGRFAQALKDDKAAKRETLTLPEKAKPPEGIQADPAQQLGVQAPAIASMPDTNAVQANQTSAPGVKTPEGLHSSLRGEFASLDPKWQAEIIRREADFHRAITTNDEYKDMGRKITQAVTPYLPTIRAEGATVEKAFEHYLQTAHVLRQGTPFQKAQALQAIAQQFNVDLNLPLQGANSSPEIAEVRHQLAETRNQLQALVQQRQEQEDQSLQSQIGTFASQPGHEHFDTVRTQMGALMEAGVTTDLEDAYQRAIWADPTIRSTLVDAQSKAAEEKRKAEQVALTGRARNAAVSVTGAPGSSRPLNGAQSHGSIEDDVRAAYSEVQGRV